VNWATVHDGQMCYLKHSVPAALGLLYHSLIEGFSAPKMVKVLDTTAYLTSQNYDRTWRRINETIEMVVACLDGSDALKPGLPGWKAVLRVRFLHTKVRLGLLRRGKWNEEQNGLPINQEDMVATQLAFSTNVLDAVQFMTGRLTRQDQEAYLHLWRYIGHLIGVREEYNPCTTMERAKNTLDVMIAHLMHPDARSGEVARNVLRAVSWRNLYAGISWSYAMHSEMARLLMGNPMADALGIERFPLHRIYAYLTWGFIYVFTNVSAPFISTWVSTFLLQAMRAQVNRALHK
jgi:hypothetical protein